MKNGLLPGNTQFSRRSFLELGSAAIASWNVDSVTSAAKTALDPHLNEAISKLQYLTPLDRAIILDKGKTGISKMPPEKIKEIGLTPETWHLEVVADPSSNCIVEQSFSRAAGNVLNWDRLMKLAEKNTVRFLHVFNCTNGPDPFHMSLWEGVPLRDVIQLMNPAENVRRVYYQSYNPEGIPPFQSSLPLGHILETPPGEMPVILAWKMNDQPIPASHGGPVRIVVPGTYGSKSIKWVQRVVLTNDYKSNDSDAELDNDPENAMKTRARFINEPKEIPAGKPAAITGMAQVGVSGLRKVQYCVYSLKSPWPADDPHRAKAEWKDAAILAPPDDWGGGLPGGKLPPTNQTDTATGAPREWPLRYTIVHWAAMLQELNPGNYELCCRTIDENGIAQPMPRMLPRTGFNSLHIVPLLVD